MEMMHVLNSELTNKENRFSQKCYIPLIYLQSSPIKINDTVVVTFQNYSYVCRVYPLLESRGDDFMYDDSVSIGQRRIGMKETSEKRTVRFPKDFSVIKSNRLEKIEVNIVIQDGKAPLSNCEDYQSIVIKLLQNFTVTSSAHIKCEGRAFADLFSIHSVIVAGTNQNDQDFGRVCESTHVDIIEILSLQQFNLRCTSEWEGELPGFERVSKVIQLLMENGERVLVSGPPGCGKSTLSQYTCTMLRTNVHIIDSNSVLEVEVPALINRINKSARLSSTSKRTPISMLYIDQIDILVPSDAKLQHVAMVTKLMESVKGIAVIATAEKRSSIHSHIQQYFKRDVFLGVLNNGQRKEILKFLLKPFPLHQVDVEKISTMVPGYVASDIVSLLQEAVRLRNKTANAENDTLTTKDFEEAKNSVTPAILKASRWNLKVKPVSWKDIGGMDYVKERLQMGVEWPLKNPEAFRRVCLGAPRGVLLFGPPGCCKTTVARGLATATHATFFAASPAQIYSPFVGQAEKNITQLFYEAKLSAPSIVFLDELDSLVGKRSLETKSHGIAEKVLSTLLNEMDGIGVNNIVGDCFSDDQTPCERKVVVVGATNRPDLIDNALLRPGRFDLLLYVPPPTQTERKSILQTVSEGMPLLDIDLDELARQTELFSGADLKNLCNTAAMDALRQNLRADCITTDNFQRSLIIVKPSITRKQIQMYELLASKYGPIITK